MEYQRYQTSFRPASPRNRIPSCSSSPRLDPGYCLQQPPSPALMGFDILRYIERAILNSSSSETGIYCIPWCPSSPAPDLGYHIQQPLSPALMDYDILQYIERAISNSSSTETGVYSPPGPDPGFRIQQPPSLALEEYMERPHLKSPSPRIPDLPDFYFPTSQMHASSPGPPLIPLVNQDGFSSDIGTQMSDLQHNGVDINPIATPVQAATAATSLQSQSATAAELAVTRNSSKTSPRSRGVVSNSNRRNSSSQNRSALLSSGSHRLVFGKNGGDMPFVNLTPRDATSIMGGVAQCGHTRTKAQRKRCAMEKRRKLLNHLGAGADAGGPPGMIPPSS